MNVQNDMFTCALLVVQTAQHSCIMNTHSLRVYIFMQLNIHVL